MMAGEARFSGENLSLHKGCIHREVFLQFKSEVYFISGFSAEFPSFSDSIPSPAVHLNQSCSTYTLGFSLYA